MNPKERMKIKIKKWHENLIKNEFGNIVKNNWNSICFEEINKLKSLIDE